MISDEMSRLLFKVRKPGRYVGGELGALNSDLKHAADVRVVLCYPDLYEVGADNGGIQLLYQCLNHVPDILCHRVFCPDLDLEQALHATGVGLWTLESHEPVRDYHFLGFSLATELSYINLITVLKSSALPVIAANRGDADSWVFAGGPAGYNPEPVAAFIDFFVLGEAEDVLPQLLVQLWQRRATPRTERLAWLSQQPGVYVPACYQFEYQGVQIAATRYLGRGQERVTRLVAKSFQDAVKTLRPVLPAVETVFDRDNVQILRGCPHKCRFCQISFITTPVRERPADDVVSEAMASLAYSGREGVSLLSLSSSDHTQIEDMIGRIESELTPKQVSVTLPSLRVDTFNETLAVKSRAVRDTGLTLAPEGGSQRMRDVVSKHISEEQILRSLQVACRAGMTRMKLYFVIGLPGEDESDLLAIADLGRKLVDAARELGHNKFKVTISCSILVPKPHTPFQWLRQISREEAEAKLNFLKKHVKGRNVELRWHDPQMAELEGILSRGDRRMATALLAAHDRGCRLDAWNEHLNYGFWLEALAQTGFETTQCLRARDTEEILPWQWVNTGVPLAYLKKEHEKTQQMLATSEAEMQVAGQAL